MLIQCNAINAMKRRGAQTTDMNKTAGHVNALTSVLL